MNVKIEERLENYIFSLKNMMLYTKFISDEPISSEYVKQPVLFNNGLFIPPQDDKLFWCYFVIKYGLHCYDLLGTHFFETEKNIKFELIEEIRNKKEVLKANQFKPISSFEDDLANNNVISLKTFMALLCIENKNIVFVEDKKIYISIRNETDDVFVLYKKENNVSYYELDLHFDKTTLNVFKENYIVVPSFSIKLKAISSYKLEELKEMCVKFGINIPTTNKILKQDLYDKIKVFF